MIAHRCLGAIAVATVGAALVAVIHPVDGRPGSAEVVRTPALLFGINHKAMMVQKEARILSGILMEG